MKALKLGVIGLGDICHAYLSNLQKYPEMIELYGCACRTPLKAEAKKEQYGFQKAYASGDELIADPDIDVILNLTTPAAHYHYNLAALQAGKHVYSEKPLASTFAEGQEIMDAAREKGLYVGCAPDTFMGARIQTIRRLLDEGILGKINGGTANCISHGWEWFHPGPEFFYQAGGGPVLDIGPYYMTALLSLLGPVEKVCAMGIQPQSARTIHSGPRAGETFDVEPEIMTSLMAVLKFRSGAIVNYNMVWDAWDSLAPRMELYGEKATVVMSDEDPNGGPNLFGGDLLIKDQSTYRWKNMPREEGDEEIPWDIAEVKHPYDAVSFVENDRGIGLVDMAEAVAQGRPNRANGDMALHMLEVSEAILVSAREERYIDIQTGFEIPAAMPQKKETHG